MIKKVLAAGAIVVAALFAAPAAANAADPGYGAPVDSGASVTTPAGTPIGVAVNVPGFTGSTADVTVDGPGAATITPIVTSTGTANVRSSVAYFSISPSVAGDYTATISSGGTTLATVTVTATSTLASTGVNDPTPTIWLAGGLVAVGIALIVTFVAVRRQNAKLKADA